MALPKLAGELYQLFDHQNYADCQRLLPAVKVELVKHNLLVPLPSNTETADQVNDVKIAERILEIGALLLLLAGNDGGFENYYALLRPFYASHKLHQRESNSDATKITALYLLYLLAQGSILRFHVELEAIYNSPQISVDKDKYLAYPIELERNLMEGNYIKIWKLLQNDAALPCAECRHFADSLVAMLRAEIAKSLEKTNDSIAISNCKTLLYFPQEQPDLTFEEVLREHVDLAAWTFRDGRIYFNSANQSDTTLDNSAIISNVLNYADQIESIV